MGFLLFPFRVFRCWKTVTECFPGVHVSLLFLDADTQRPPPTNSSVLKFALMVSCIIPSKFLVDGMMLLWSGKEGRYSSSTGEVLVFDPSLQEKGPSALLIQKEAFLQFLREHDLALLWTIRGEKNAYGNGDWPESFAGRFTVTGAYTYSEQGKLRGKLSVQDIDASKRDS